jgi:hypothetical protein
MVKKGKLSATAAGAAAAKLAALRAAAVRDGYDKEHGGVFEAGVPGQASGTGEGVAIIRKIRVQRMQRCCCCCFVRISFKRLPAYALARRLR